MATETKRRVTYDDVSWNGVSYPNITAMAEALGVRYQTAFDRYHKGQRCDDDLHAKWKLARERKANEARQPKRTALVFEGVEYASMSKLAQALGVARATAKKRCEAQQRASIGADGTSFTYNGLSFASINDMVEFIAPELGRDEKEAFKQRVLQRLQDAKS